MSGRERIGRSRRSGVGLLVVLPIVMLVSSCGKSVPDIKGALPVYPVKGSVTMNGQPVPDALLLFHPVTEFSDEASKIRPRANVDEDGTFQVTTYRPDDGAPAGEYIVTVSWKGPLAGLGGDDDDRPEMVPARFRLPKTSKLNVRISEGENTLPAWDLAELERQASNNP